MQRFRCQAIRSSGRVRWLAILALVSALAAGGVGQIGLVSVEVQPANPTTQDGVTLLPSGEWKDSCTSPVKEVRRAGGSITVYTESWPGLCRMVITSWHWREEVPTAQEPPTVRAEGEGAAELHRP